MPAKIISFPSREHPSTVNPSTIEPVPDYEIDLSCSVIALDFATKRKTIPELACEWALDERIIVEVLRSEILRTCPEADRIRYQLAEC